MAIKLQREIGNSGLSAEHWVLTSIHSYRDGNTERFYASAHYSLFVSREAFEAGKAALGSNVVVNASDGVPVDQDPGPFFDALAVAPEVAAVLDEVPVVEGAAPLEAGAADAEGAPAPDRRPAPAPRVLVPAVAAGPLAGGEIAL